MNGPLSLEYIEGMKVKRIVVGCIRYNIRLIEEECEKDIVCLTSIRQLTTELQDLFEYYCARWD